MDIRNGNYLHRFPEGEDDGHHQVGDGPYCPCSPREVPLPLVVADRQGYASVIHHASLLDRRAGRPA